MAIELTQITPELAMFPWADTGAPDSSDKSLRPLGVLQAKVRDTTIAVPAAGDNQVVSVTTVLPVNFMYVLTDIAAYMRTVGLVAANNWEEFAGLLFFDSAGPAIIDTIEYPMGYNSTLTGASNLTANRAWIPFGPLPKFLQVGGSTWNSVFTNNTNDDISGNLNFMARWVVYTVSQQYDAGVNTPQLIR